MTDNPPRLIGRKEAADYCGISPSCFSMWVANHKMPPAVPGTRKWDKKAIDARLDEISGLGSAAQPEDPYDKWMREHGEERRARNAYRPHLKLREGPQRVLLFMAAHPECDTVGQIRGAGQLTIDKLMTEGAVKSVGIDPAGQHRYALTKLGKEEAARLEQWFSR